MEFTENYVISIPEQDIVFPLRLLTVGYTEAKPKDIYKRQNYTVCTVEFVMEGAGFLEVNGNQYYPEAGDMYILHLGSDHLYYPNEQRTWKKIYFVVTGPLVEELFRAYQLHNIDFIPKCGLEESFKKMFELAQLQTMNLYQQAAVLFHQMLYELSAQISLSNHEIAEDMLVIKEYLDVSTEKRVVMKDLEHLVKLSSSHIIRKFKKEFGNTPYDYLLNRRIETAKNYLSSTGTTIKAIAYRLQFADEYYFSTFFKKRVGESPSSFRKRHKLSGFDP